MGRLARYHCAREEQRPRRFVERWVCVQMAFCSALCLNWAAQPNQLNRHTIPVQSSSSGSKENRKERAHAQSLTPPNHACTVSGDAALSAGPRTRKLCTPAFDLAGRTQARGSRHALLDTTGLFAVATHRQVRRLHQAPLPACSGRVHGRPARRYDRHTIRRAVVAGWAYAPGDAAAPPQRLDRTARGHASSRENARDATRPDPAGSRTRAFASVAHASRVPARHSRHARCLRDGYSGLLACQIGGAPCNLPGWYSLLPRRSSKSRTHSAGLSAITGRDSTAAIIPESKLIKKSNRRALGKILRHRLDAKIFGKTLL
jgi:hypothetical protein